MLEELEVRDMGPIQHAILHPSSGMTAITGETGAGKSMLLNAVSLISGAAAQTARVSPGQDASWAQGIFNVDSGSPVEKVLEDAGMGLEEGQVFLARSVPGQGRSRSLVNGHTAPRTLLEELSAQLVTVHGQADQMRMASAVRQREFLDNYADIGEKLQAFRKLWEHLRHIDDKINNLTQKQASAVQQADYLRESISKIDQVNPELGEDEELKEQRDRIEHSAQIMQGVTGALLALDAGQLENETNTFSVASLIEQAIQSLQAIGVNDIFDEAITRLDAVNAELSDIVFGLTRQIDSDSDAGDLDTINARIHDIEELKERWGPSIKDVLSWREQAEYDLEDLDASPEKVKELQVQRQSIYQETLTAAEALSKKREAAAKRLSKKVTEELKELAMNGAALTVQVTPRSDARLDSYGFDDVTFFFTPFPGSPQLPMGSSASGGELSRLMLALELVSGQTGAMNKGQRQTQYGKNSSTSQSEIVPPMTFIFDEVDAGVGGKAAVELGKRLASLAKSAQVIVVTHLAQVASWADRQFVVSKTSERSQAITSVREVEGSQREQEIARMLAGSESDTSLQHARELLESSSLV